MLFTDGDIIHYSYFELKNILIKLNNKEYENSDTAFILCSISKNQRFLKNNT